MKKTYAEPQVEIIVVEEEDIIVMSILSSSTTAVQYPDSWKK